MTLESLSDRYWKAYSRYVPTVATTRGEHEFDDELRHFDDGWLAEMADGFRSISEEASQLETSSMTTHTSA